MDPYGSVPIWVVTKSTDKVAYAPLSMAPHHVCLTHHLLCNRALARSGLIVFGDPFEGVLVFLKIPIGEKDKGDFFYLRVAFKVIQDRLEGGV